MKVSRRAPLFPSCTKTFSASRIYHESFAHAPYQNHSFASCAIILMIPDKKSAAGDLVLIQLQRPPPPRLVSGSLDLRIERHAASTGDIALHFVNIFFKFDVSTSTNASTQILSGKEERDSEGRQIRSQIKPH